MINYYLNPSEKWLHDILDKSDTPFDIITKRILDNAPKFEDSQIIEYTASDTYFYDKSISGISMKKLYARFRHTVILPFAKDVLRHLRTKAYSHVHIHFADLACEMLPYLEKIKIPKL